MTQENTEMISQIAAGIDATVDEVTDNILTTYRAMRNAHLMERVDNSFPEFMRVDGKLLQGERLYTMLLSMFRAELLPNPAPINVEGKEKNPYIQKATWD